MHKTKNDQNISVINNNISMSRNHHINNISNVNEINKNMSILDITSRRKRRFDEMDLNPYGEIEKGLDSVYITKRLKLNGNDNYITKTIEIPHNQYYNDKEDDILVENNNENIKVKIDMETEKKMVENFYSQKNKTLLNAMFGNN